MESAPEESAPSPTDLSMPRSKRMVIGFWIVTALFCLQMSHGYQLSLGGTFLLFNEGSRIKSADGLEGLRVLALPRGTFRPLGPRPSS